jgi:trehalose 6-phosphate synthase/phosphatase
VIGAIIVHTTSPSSLVISIVHPLIYSHQAIDRDEYFGLLSVADLALITSLRDGMNTTSMEFTLCQDKTNKSPLVLSEFMGTSSSFQSALTINPHDLLGVAGAIHKGLTMSQAEKEERHNTLLDSVLGHTSHSWANTVLKHLLENVGGENTAHQTPALDTATMTKAYTKAKKRLMLFDYDVSSTSVRAGCILVLELTFREHSHPLSRSHPRLSRLNELERPSLPSLPTPTMSST